MIAEYLLKKRLIRLCLLAILWSGSYVADGSLKAADIVSIEYFFNSDPGEGNGVVTAVSPSSTIDQNLSVSLAGLTEGFHKLYIRTKDGEGRWSQPFVQNVLLEPESVPTSTEQITHGEYFLNTDPGEGNGIAFAVTAGVNIESNFNVDLTGVSNGNHNLYIRTRNAKGIWSIPQVYNIFKFELETPPVNTNIVAAEYFFNGDPGEGNGTVIDVRPGVGIDTNFVVDLSSVASGFHKLFIRTKNANGAWSIPSVHSVYKHFEDLPGLKSPITAAEYFFDTDPGEGNGLAVPVRSATSIDTSFTVDLSSVSAGFHKLYIRTRDANLRWSIPTVSSIYKHQSAAPQTTAQINAAEYYIDTDPGEGNGVAFPVRSGTVVDTSFLVDLSGVSSGFHKLYFRTRNANLQWSKPHMTPIYKDPESSGNGTPLITNGEYFIDTDPGFDNGTGFAVQNATTSNSSFNVDLSAVSEGAHKVYFRIKNDNGQWSHANVNDITVADATTPIANCQDITVQLDANGEASITPAQADNGSDAGSTGLDSLSLSQSNFICNDHFVTVKLFVTANNGKRDSCLSQVTVLDDINPVDTCQGIPISNNPPPVPSNITAMEYFFDTYPGEGSGIPVAVTPGINIEQNFNVSLSSVTFGEHFLYIRTRNANRQWSIPSVHRVFKLDDSQTAPNPLAIVAAEYFYNTDPGEGNGTAIAISPGGNINELFNLDLTSLSFGNHKVYIRTKNSGGSWSHVQTYSITKIDDSQVSGVALPVAAAEYYFNSDPGEGNGIAIPVNPGVEVDLNPVLDLTTANLGFNRVYFRTANTAGEWSHSLSFAVTKLPENEVPGGVANITAA